MNCITCEVARARIAAVVMHIRGDSMEVIAEKLSVKYGERYISYVAWKDGKIVDGVKRHSKLPPHIDYNIIGVNRDERSTSGCQA